MTAPGLVGYMDLRSWLYRSRGKNSAAPRQPFWPKSVTYVLGILCYPCVRVGQLFFWLRGKDLNLRPLGYEPNELPDCSTPQRYGSAAPSARQIFAGKSAVFRLFL